MTQRRTAPSSDHRIAHAETLTSINLALLLFLVAPAVWGDGDLQYMPGQSQLELVPGVSIEDIHERYGTSTLDALQPLYLVGIPNGANEEELIGLLKEDPDIEDAEYSWAGETPEATRQMVVTAVGGEIEGYLDQHLVERIHLAEIHEHTRGDGILVAVIDTGVFGDHPALAGAIALDGYDFFDNDADPGEEANEQDDDGDGLIDEAAGHGTMVAGIVHLVAPRAKILPIRVLGDEGQGRTFTVAKAIRYAIEQGADVINLSLGLTHSCFSIRHEIKLADSLSVAVVAAAGNLAAENPPYYPAIDTHALSVAALDSSDVKADFSNWHDRVAVSAPGVGVYAPYYDGGYAIGAGTSFASPFVAGQCALILALNPSLALDEVYAYVGLGVEEIYSIPGNEEYLDKLGAGRIDGYQTWLNTPAAANVRDGGFAVSSPLRVSPNPAALGDEVVLWFDKTTSRSVLRANIYDATGRLVKILSVDGVGTADWDGLDRNGRFVPSGVYFVRLSGITGSLSQDSGARLVLLD